MTDFISVHVSAGSHDEAAKIAQVVVEERLAACANIVYGVQSVYRWHEKVEQTEECLILIKTRSDKFEPLKKRIKSLHSYDCPCIVATPITTGDVDYLNWLGENV